MGDRTMKNHEFEFLYRSALPSFKWRLDVRHFGGVGRAAPNTMLPNSHRWQLGGFQVLDCLEWPKEVDWEAAVDCAD